MYCEECEDGCLILGVDDDATREEIRTAYRDLVKVWHPDRFGGDERLRRKADDHLKKINEAYSHVSSHQDRELELSDDECLEVDEDLCCSSVEEADPSGQITDCPTCGREIERQTFNQIVDSILKLGAGQCAIIYAPIVCSRYDKLNDILDNIEGQGFRIRINGEWWDSAHPISLKANDTHTLEVLVDRIVFRQGTEKRLTSSVAKALELAKGALLVSFSNNDKSFTSLPACYGCAADMPNLDRRSFLFYGRPTLDTDELGTPSSVPKSVIDVQSETKHSPAHGSLFCRVMMILLRTVWRSTTIIFAVLLILAIIAIFLTGVFMALWRYWEGRAASEKDHPDASLINDKLLSFIEGITWVPRKILGGLLLLLTPGILALIFTGQAFLEFVSSHSIGSLIASGLLGVGILVWVFLGEWKLEFASPSYRREGTVSSWVLGLVVIVALFGAVIWRSHARQEVANVYGELNNSDRAPTLENQPESSPRKSPNPSSTLNDAGRASIEPDSTDLATGGQVIGSEFTIQKAFTALFGNYDPSSSTSSVKEENSTDGNVAQVTAILDVQFFQAGKQKHLVVTSTKFPGMDCHPCGARIGVYVFSNFNGRWIAEIAEKEALRFGTFGMVDSAQAVRFAPDKLGFSLTGQNMHQGVKDTAIQFVAPIKDKYLPVLVLETELDSTDACEPTGLEPCYHNKSTARFLDSIHGLFDIEVDKSGTEYSDRGTVVPANRHELYVFTGDKYERQDSAPAAPRGGALSQHPDDEYAVREAVAKWVEAFRSKKSATLAATYAPVVEKYFRKEHLSREEVQRNIESGFAHIEAIRTYEVNDVKIELLSAKNQADDGISHGKAVVTFHKAWETTQVDSRTFTGEEIESLTFDRFPEGWKIVREEELNIIRASKR